MSTAKNLSHARKRGCQEPAPAPMSPRDRMEMRLRKIIRGPDAGKAIELILGDADEYAAWMAEIVARPDDRWEPQ